MEIKWSKGKEDYDNASMIRREVFVKEQKVPLELDLDEFDDVAYHIVGYDKELPVAVGRLLEREDHYLVGRIAVLKEKRGYSYGKIIMEEIIKKVKELGGGEIQLHAQITAKGFYEKLGFLAYGDIYFEADIKHVSMKLVLK